MDSVLVLTHIFGLFLMGNEDKQMTDAVDSLGIVNKTAKGK